MGIVKLQPAVRIAAAYIRVSTDDQVELSPASQLAEIRRWASAHGFVVPDELIYSDEGISGRKTTGRDAFRRMIADAKRKPKPFDAILLWKYSRFARNRDDAILYKSLLRKQLGIEVLSISEPMVEGPMGVITEALIEAMDEFYSLNLGQEVRRGMAEKHRRGEWQSTPPYGYAVKDHRLTPKEPEASYVRELFRRFAAGEGTYPLARWLNSCGEHTHRGSLFENRTVEYILYNPVYVGKIRWNPATKTKRNYQEEHVMVVDGCHEALVSQELFDAVQTRLAQVKALYGYKGKPAAVQRDWMTGLVRCSACGSTLVFQKPRYWKCNNYARGRCRTSNFVTDEALRAAVLGRLTADLCADGLDFRPVRASDGGEAEEASLRAARATVERTLERVKQAYLSGVDTLEEYRDRKAQCAAQLADIDARLAAHAARTKELTAPSNLTAAIRKTLKTLNDPSATTTDRYTAAHTIIDRAVFDKSQNLLTIHYRLIF